MVLGGVLLQIILQPNYPFFILSIPQSCVFPKLCFGEGFVSGHSWFDLIPLDFWFPNDIYPSHIIGHFGRVRVVFLNWFSYQSNDR